MLPPPVYPHSVESIRAVLSGWDFAIVLGIHPPPGGFLAYEMRELHIMRGDLLTAAFTLHRAGIYDAIGGMSRDGGSLIRPGDHPGAFRCSYAWNFCRGQDAKRCGAEVFRWGDFIVIDLWVFDVERQGERTVLSHCLNQGVCGGLGSRVVRRSSGHLCILGRLSILCKGKASRLGSKPEAMVKAMGTLARIC